MSAEDVTPPGRGHIPALDGVRGLAILLVLMAHFGELFYDGLGVSVSGRPADALLLAAARLGWTGVDLFFVLSGFLITGLLYDAKGSGRYFVNFYGRRTARIFPLYYGVLVAVFVVGPWLGVGRGINRALGADQAWFWLYGVNVLAALKGHTFPLVHFWSLAVEEHFYLVWPMVVRVMERGALMTTCVVVGLGALGLRVWMQPRFNSVAIYVLTPCRIDSLAAGALLALAVRGPRGVGAVRPFAPAAVMAGVLALAAGRIWQAGLHTPWVQTIGFSLFALVFWGLIALVISGPPGSVATRVFSAGWLRSLGKYSYGIYVYHVFVMSTLARKLPPAGLTAAVGSSAAACLVFLLAGVMLSFAVAFVSWWIYERPFLSLKERFFRYG